MAELHITEFELNSIAPDGESLWIGNLSQIVTQQVVTFASSTQSNAFNKRTSFVRLYADQKAFLKIDADNPVAKVEHTPIAPNSPEYFGVSPGDKLAVYDGTS